VACALRVELCPVRLTRRVNDIVAFDTPRWRTPLEVDLTGKVVAVVDEIADTGETLRLVAERARKLGAARVVTATLVGHTWASPPPDVTALVTDALVLFPWDQRVLINGVWQLHPEIETALRAQQPRTERSSD
jgi:hypoxanthine phosphoribosyltransferase